MLARRLRYQDTFLAHNTHRRLYHHLLLVRVEAGILLRIIFRILDHHRHHHRISNLQRMRGRC